MSRWLTWPKRRSRRRRFIRSRILRIDELENRRLLCGTLLDGSVGESFQHDESEIEDHVETDERDDLLREATVSHGAVVDSGEAEGEDDGWDDGGTTKASLGPTPFPSHRPAAIRFPRIR